MEYVNPKEFWIQFVTDAKGTVAETNVYGRAPQVPFDYHVIEYREYEATRQRANNEAALCVKFRNQLDKALEIIRHSQPGETVWIEETER